MSRIVIQIPVTAVNSHTLSTILLGFFSYSLPFVISLFRYAYSFDENSHSGPQIRTTLYDGMRCD